jgi:hypothetical protein
MPGTVAPGTIGRLEAVARTRAPCVAQQARSARENAGRRAAVVGAATAAALVVSWSGSRPGCRWWRRRPRRPRSGSPRSARGGPAVGEVGRGYADRVADAVEVDADGAQGLAVLVVRRCLGGSMSSGRREVDVVLGGHVSRAVEPRPWSVRAAYAVPRGWRAGRAVVVGTDLGWPSSRAMSAACATAILASVSNRDCMGVSSEESVAPAVRGGSRGSASGEPPGG